MPIPENLLVELRAELAEVRSLLVEAVADFAVYQEGILRLHDEQLKAIKFYRRRSMAVGLVILVIVLFGTVQILSTNQNVRQTKAIAQNTNELAEEVDCVVRVAAEVPQEDQPAAYGKCLRPGKGR